MDLNPFGNSPLSPPVQLQQDPNFIFSSQAAYPVANQSPPTQQPPFYPNANPQYPPVKSSHDHQRLLVQQRQQQQQQQQQQPPPPQFSFGAVTTAPITQSIGSGGAMMSSGLPQSSGMLHVNPSISCLPLRVSLQHEVQVMPANLYSPIVLLRYGIRNALVSSWPWPCFQAPVDRSIG